MRGFELEISDLLTPTLSSSGEAREKTAPYQDAPWKKCKVFCFGTIHKTDLEIKMKNCIYFLLTAGALNLTALAQPTNTMNYNEQN